MTLAKFIEEEKKLLEEFEEYWIVNYQEDPDNYPLDMLQGNWSEQFINFVENENYY